MTGHEEEILGKAYDGRLMRRLLRYLRPYRARVALAILLLLTAAAVELVGPWLTKIAIDEAIPAGDRSLLLLLTLGFVAALQLAFVLEFAQTLLTTWLGQRIMFDLRREIFGHLQRLRLPFLDRNPVGRLMTRVTNDVEVLNELFSSGIVTVFGDIFTLVGILVVMLLLDWRLALVSYAVLPLVMLVAFVFRARIRDAYRDIRTRLARINAFLQERITGMSVVKLFGRERETGERFRRIDAEYLDAHLRSITYYALFFPVIEVLTAVALALIIAYGGSQVLDGTITVGVVAAFLQYARRFFRPIQDLSEKYNMLQGAMASSERIFRLLDEPVADPGSRIPDAGQAAPPAEPRGFISGIRNRGSGILSRGELEFRNVWFAYIDREDGEPEWVLRDVSFRIPAGERVAVVGHTGAGKTTLASLLMRFYEPQRGEILFDGVPIRDIPVRELRDRIGLVLQDVFLFSRDVAYNIRFGRDDISEAAMRAAAESVGAADFIAKLPQQYATPLGERGVTLSVGQRQLLSFARALAFDPLVLILDEATSSVDSSLEERIERAVETLLRGRTALVIAHRLSTVQTADRILVLHHGELREQGTHTELLATDGLYSRLHELQFAGSGAAAVANP
ncbi:MAG TPA: ABC transporter ATP-binding protein [Longimicrobiales bacterium]|nr:ABC transporter ATP-binding protein [Longimicrobiales bacterium]